MIRSKVANFYEETNVRALIGWLIFIALFFADDFNPFIFGFGYYVIYTFSKMEDATQDLLTQRLIAVGVIALLSLWTTINLQGNRSDFIEAFEATCGDRNYGSNNQAKEVCESIRMDIDERLRSRDDYSGGEDY